MRAITLVNFTLLACGVLLANLFLDHRQFAANITSLVKTDVETELARQNAAYFNQCLADDHVQMFYPDLMRSADFRALAEEFAFLPLGPVPAANTAYCNEGLGFVTYLSDRFGFRNADNNWDRPIDTLLVGDSYVQGACVDERATFTHLLEQRLGTNIVNVSTGSNSPEHYTRLIETFVPIFNPRRVVLFFYPNDNVTPYDENLFLQGGRQPAEGYGPSGVSPEATTFYTRIISKIAPSTAIEDAILSCEPESLRRQDLVARIEAAHSGALMEGQPFASWISERFSPYGLKQLITLRATRSAIRQALTVRDSSQVASPEVTVASINALFQTCSGSCRPAVVLLEQSNYWRPDPRIDAYYTFILQQIQIAVGDEPYDLIDIRGVVDSNGLDDFAPLGPHYSPQGYAKAADAIAQGLDRQ